MDKLLSRAAIVGGGRVGMLLASIVEELNGSLSVITTQSPNRASLIRAKSRSTPVICWSSSSAVSEELVSTISGELTLLVIAVRDDALTETVARLAAARPSWVGCTVVHCSGTNSLALLNPFLDKGADAAALHPCYPIVSDIELADRADMVWSIEASSFELSRSIELAMARWGARTITLGQIDRPLYHASQVLGAGHVVALYALVEKLLVQSKLAPEQARKVISSLLSGICKNVQRSEVGELRTMLTGPFVRGDRAVIERQLKVLEDVDHEASVIYELVGNLVSRVSNEK